MIRYNKTQINNIIKNSIDSKLSEEVIEIINNLTEMVGDPEYIKTPQFEKVYKGDKGDKMDRNYNKFKKKNDIVEWNGLRNFEITDIKKKQGIGQYMDIIRKYLNKMTDKTYLTSREKIIETLDLIIKIADDDELGEISDSIFGIVSSNIFYSVMYASLYKDLIQKFDILKYKISTSLLNYKQVILDIKYVDAIEDYDKFCENNKINENNRALLLFYVNLMKEDVIEKENIIEIICFLYERFFELIDQENKKGEIEELSELLYLLIKNSYEKINECEDWNKIYSNIEFISKLKSKDKPSISNKSIFKHMDILDEFN
jgi:hypothetical protein